MDVPFASLKHVCSSENEHRYEPYGIVFAKEFAYSRGVRPVLYLSNKELELLKL